MGVEEIQDAVEERIMEVGAFHVARAYITYRYRRQLVRQSNTTDRQIMTIIESQNEDIKQENSNKKLFPLQRGKSVLHLPESLLSQSPVSLM